MKTTEKEEKFLEEVYRYSQELAAMDDSDTVAMLEKYGFPVEALEEIKRRTKFDLTDNFLDSLHEKELFSIERREEKSSKTEGFPASKSFKIVKEKVDYLRFDEETLQKMKALVEGQN